MAKRDIKNKVQHLIHGSPTATAPTANAEAAATTTNYQEAKSVPLFSPPLKRGLPAQPSTLLDQNQSPTSVEVRDSIRCAGNRTNRAEH